MKKEQLLATCRKLINDMEDELKDNDIWDALDDIREVFGHFKELEAQIDILSPKEEKKLDEIIEILGKIDVDKLKSAKEVIEIVDTVQGLLSTFKSKILMGQSEEILDMVENIRSLLEIMVKRL